MSVASTTKPAHQDFGESLGSFRSTSEKVQTVLVGGGVICGLICAVLRDNDELFFLSIIGSLVVTGLIYLVVRQISWFSDKVELFQEGVVLTLGGKVTRILFAQMTDFKMSTTDHHTNGVYIGSRAKLEFGIEGAMRLINCDLEYKNSKDSGRIIGRLNDLATSSVRDQLAKKLEVDGQIRWTPDVVLTMDAIQIIDASSLEERSTPIEDVERCDVQNNELRLYRKGEGLPFCVMSVDHRNFSAVYALFASLHNCYRDQENAKVESMDLHVAKVAAAVSM